MLGANDSAILPSRKVLSATPALGAAGRTRDHRAVLGPLKLRRRAGRGYGECRAEPHRYALVRRLRRDAVRDDRWCAAGHVGCGRSEEHTSELQSRLHLVCRLLLEKKNTT